MTYTARTPSSPETDLSDVLQEVRTAFRLVQMYHRRALDLTLDLANGIDHELRFQSWSPTLYERPCRSGSNPATHWAWDGLPFYDFYVLYCREDMQASVHKPGDWMVAIRLIADDGYEHKPPEPDPTDFALPEKSSSLVNVYRYQYTRSMDETWLYSFNKHPWPTSEEPAYLSDSIVANCVSVPIHKLSGSDQLAQLAERIRQPLTLPDSP